MRALESVQRRHSFCDSCIVFIYTIPRRIDIHLTQSDRVYFKNVLYSNIRVNFGFYKLSLCACKSYIQRFRTREAILTSQPTDPISDPNQSAQTAVQNQNIAHSYIAEPGMPWKRNEVTSNAYKGEEVFEAIAT